MCTAHNVQMKLLLELNAMKLENEFFLRVIGSIALELFQYFDDFVCLLPFEMVEHSTFAMGQCDAKWFWIHKILEMHFILSIFELMSQVWYEFVKLSDCYCHFSSIWISEFIQKYSLTVNPVWEFHKRFLSLVHETKDVVNLAKNKFSDSLIRFNYNNLQVICFQETAQWTNDQVT